ncbi:MAG: hypothetical protein C0511_14870 [Hyphomicrobium sp.]|nr:hypothetical protein [Hyphomicrobium sp.]PPC80281.1 MAG: hypothetical protein CTY40_09495 [Hyphomicrobium sp.]
MLRNLLCVALLSLTIIGTADIMRSASTHLTTFLAVSAAEAASPVRVSDGRRDVCDPAYITSPACQRRLQVASRY